MFPILETERLILREITKEDAEGIFACFSNENVTRYYGQETLESIEEAEKFVDFFSNNYNEKEAYAGGLKKRDQRYNWNNWL